MKIEIEIPDDKVSLLRREMGWLYNSIQAAIEKKLDETKESEKTG